MNFERIYPRWLIAFGTWRDVPYVLEVMIGVRRGPQFDDRCAGFRIKIFVIYFGIFYRWGVQR